MNKKITVIRKKREKKEKSPDVLFNCVMVFFGIILGLPLFGLFLIDVVWPFIINNPITIIILLFIIIIFFSTQPPKTRNKITSEKTTKTQKLHNERFLDY